MTTEHCTPTFQQRIYNYKDRLHSEIKNSELFSTDDWQWVAAVTLTFKQQITARDGRLAALDELLAKKNFRHFMKVLNRAVYGNAHRNHNKRLRVIPVLEKDRDGRWHYHVAIEPPLHLTPQLFELEIWCCWTRTHWGNREMKIQHTNNEYWKTYMLKRRQKGDLECWFDTIDLDALHNPTAHA